MMLTEAEKRSELWRKIKAHLDGRLAMHRGKNDTDLGDTETAKLRGRIQECKEMLKLGAEPGPADEPQKGERL